MYKFLIRPLLFLFRPEPVHRFVAGWIRVLFLVPGIAPLVRACFRVRHPSLRREVFGISFENPVGLAAGFDKNARYFRQFSAFGFSFIEVGTVTPLAQPGNPRPRSFRFKEDGALINRMGFNNEGATAAARRLGRRRGGIIIGGNLGKNTATPNEKAVEDYASAFQELYETADYFAVNVSCPNISDLGHLQDREQLDGILARLASIRQGKSVKKPILVKISPDLNKRQIDDVIDLVRQNGMDGIIATNTTIAREGMKTDPARVKAAGSGGLSGIPLRERSTEIIRYIHEKTGGALPVIGVGGIMSPRDAREKLDAGASLIQLYTGFIYEGPSLVRRINRSLLRNP